MLNFISEHVICARSTKGAYDGALATAFETASEALVPDLAGVSVVLEGISAADLPILSVTWDDGSSRTLELTSA